MIPYVADHTASFSRCWGHGPLLSTVPRNVRDSCRVIGGRAESNTVYGLGFTGGGSLGTDPSSLRYQSVLCTMRGTTSIWGFIYGHVCENGVTREVLPPRPLKCFTFMDSDLLESQDRLRESWVQRSRTFSR